MQDRKMELEISVGSATAWSLWGLTAAVLVIAALLGCVILAGFGCALSAAAATATVRVFLVKLARDLSNVFELGRDYGEIRAERRVPRAARFPRQPQPVE